MTIENFIFYWYPPIMLSLAPLLLFIDAIIEKELQKRTEISIKAEKQPDTEQ